MCIPLENSVYFSIVVMGTALIQTRICIVDPSQIFRMKMTSDAWLVLHHWEIYQRALEARKNPVSRRKPRRGNSIRCGIHMIHVHVYVYYEYIFTRGLTNSLDRTQTLVVLTLQRRHYEHDGISNHQPRNCLLNCLFRHRSKKTSKLHITGLCEGNSPVTGEFPVQRASNKENVSIWWCRHAGKNYWY